MVETLLFKRIQPSSSS